MAKVKRIQPLEGETWDLSELGAVQHTSRWGTIARSKGSTLRYYPGCPWEKGPKPPEGPPRGLPKLLLGVSGTPSVVWWRANGLDYISAFVPSCGYTLVQDALGAYVPGSNAIVECTEAGFAITVQYFSAPYARFEWAYGERYPTVGPAGVPASYYYWQYVPLPYACRVDCPPPP